MENETDLIRDQMTETRTALTEKLEALEEKVVSTVQDTTATVAETVSNVTEKVQETVSDVSESVHETVETVKSAFDLPHQTREHPWAMFGGAVALGFLGGRLLPSGERMASAAAGLAGSRPSWSPSAYGTTGTTGATPARTSESSWFSGLSEQLAPALKEVQGMAIGALTGLVGQMVLRSVPENFRPQLEHWIDDVARSLGGKPIEGLKEYVDQQFGGQQHQASPQQQHQPSHTHTATI